MAGGRGRASRRSIATQAAQGLEATARARIAQAPDGGAAAARQEAIAAAVRAIDRYETIPRRFPTSGYSDNALFQAADLAGTLYAAYGRVAHRELVTKYVTWLVREYPSSSLRTEARAKLRSVEATRLAHLARSRLAAGAASQPEPGRRSSPAGAPPSSKRRARKRRPRPPRRRRRPVSRSSRRSSGPSFPTSSGSRCRSIAR